MTVTVKSDRWYSFAIDRAALWAAMTHVSEYQRWWPWLTGFEAHALEVGDSWRCVVKPPFPYSLTFVVVLEQVEPGDLVVASIHGDIVGSARLEIRRQETGCEVHLASSLAPANKGLQAVAFVARPMVHFGHDWVLDTGAGQFRQRAF